MTTGGVCMKQTSSLVLSGGMSVLAGWSLMRGVYHLMLRVVLHWEAHERDHA